jgi:DNA-binding transcriptional LysR family regulator
MPEIREIQVFLALIQSGSFSGAAKELKITQPAVSAHISKLEQVIGFHLFHRSPEGATMTDQARLILPHLEHINREYNELLQRVDYWNRFQLHEVKIWTDGSHLSQEMKTSRSQASDQSTVEIWKYMEVRADWANALKSFETDIVVTGSFLKSADSPEIRASTLTEEPGMTVAWNPGYYAFNSDAFSFPDAISSSVILPTESLANGFREFLSKWCETTYGIHIRDVMEFGTEQAAAEACHLGLGVLVFPGDAATRLRLTQMGLATQPAFRTLLPKAFQFGIRWRMGEKNPAIIATVRNLIDRFASSGKRAN